MVLLSNVHERIRGGVKLTPSNEENATVLPEEPRRPPTKSHEIPRNQSKSQKGYSGGLQCCNTGGLLRRTWKERDKPFPGSRVRAQAWARADCCFLSGGGQMRMILGNVTIDAYGVFNSGVCNGIPAPPFVDPTAIVCGFRGIPVTNETPETLTNSEA